jgi:hypothetical protein
LKAQCADDCTYDGGKKWVMRQTGIMVELAKTAISFGRTKEGFDVRDQVAMRSWR